MINKLKESVDDDTIEYYFVTLGIEYDRTVIKEVTIRVPIDIMLKLFPNLLRKNIPFHERFYTTITITNNTLALIIRNNLLKKTKDDFDKKTNQVRLTYKNRNNTWNSLKHFWLYIIKYKNLADNYLKDREGNNPVFQEMKQKHDLIYVKFTEPFNQKGGANVGQFNRQPKHVRPGCTCRRCLHGRLIQL